MGRTMAMRLLEAGYEVHVHDVSEAAVSAVRDSGARPGGSPRGVAAAADVVLMSLPNSSLIEEVVLGRDGLLEAAGEGMVIIDLSSARLSDPPGQNDTVLLMAPDEIAVCDDDASAPERGRIELTIEGGR